MSWEDDNDPPAERIEMGRREFTLVAALMAFLLAFFPWLRDDEEIAQKIAERLVVKGSFNLTLGIKGFEVSDAWLQELQNDPEIRRARLKAERTAKGLPNRHDRRRAQRAVA